MANENEEDFEKASRNDIRQYRLSIERLNKLSKEDLKTETFNNFMNKYLPSKKRR